MRAYKGFPFHSRTMPQPEAPTPLPHPSSGQCQVLGRVCTPERRLSGERRIESWLPQGRSSTSGGRTGLRAMSTALSWWLITISKGCRCEGRRSLVAGDTHTMRRKLRCEEGDCRVWFAKKNASDASLAVSGSRRDGLLLDAPVRAF